MRHFVWVAALALPIVLGACGEDPPAQKQKWNPQRPTTKTEPAPQPAPDVAPAAPSVADGAELFRAVSFVKGLPTGAHPLKPEEVAAGVPHVRVYTGANGRIERRGPGGYVERSWHVSDSEAGSDITVRDGGGRALEHRKLSAGGATMVKTGPDGRLLDPACGRYQRDLDSHGFVVAERCESSDGFPRADRDGVHERRFERSEAGLATGVRHQDLYGDPLAVSAGPRLAGPERAVYQKRTSFDALGRATEEANFDRNDQPTTDTTGVHVRAWSYDAAGFNRKERWLGVDRKELGALGTVAAIGWSYDERGRLVEELLLGANGKPRDGALGFARTAYRVDESGRPTSIRWLDRKGNAALHPELGAYGKTLTYDAKGRVVAEGWLGDDAAPASPPRYGWAGLQRTYDEAGRITSETTTGPDGALLAPAGRAYAKRAMTYDDAGRVTAERFEDASGKPVRTRGAYAALVYTYTDADPAKGAATQVTSAAQDEAGAPIRRFGVSYSKVVETRDAGGRWLERRTFDVDGKPTIGDVAGIHAELRTYDAANNLLSRRFEGVTGSPAFHPELGCAGITRTFDSRGEERSQTLLGLQGTPAVGPQGWAKRERVFDTEGRLSEIRYQGPDGKPTWHTTKGVAKEHFFYGLSRQVREVSFFGTDDKPVLVRPGGYTKEGRTVDEHGRVIAGVYEGLDNEEPVIHLEKGYASWRDTYDDGLMVLRAFSDAEGARVMIPFEGYSALAFEYDRLGRLVREKRLDDKDKLTNTPAGYAIRDITAGKRNVVAESYLDKSGKSVFANNGYAGIERKLNEAGQPLQESYLDTLGELTPDREGAARKVWTYWGDVVTSFRTFGPDGKPAAAHFGTTGYRRTLDVRGWVTREEMLATNDERLRDPRTGCAGFERTLDPSGSITGEVCLGTDGPTLGMEGWAARRITRDARGLVTKIERMDDAGAPIAGRNGWATRVDTYDDHGRLIKSALSGADGLPTLSDEGWAQLEIGYDTSGRKVEVSHKGLEGELLNRTDGWCRKEWRYDHVGRMVEVTTSDPTGQLIEVDGAAGHRKRFDSQGLIAEETVLGPAGQPKVGPAGWATTRYEHGRGGKETMRRYFDAGGRPGHAKLNIAAERRRYNAFGMVTRIDSLGPEDTLQDRVGPFKRRWATESHEYDRLGNLVGQSFHHADGTKAMGPQGVYRTSHWEYNSRGQLIRQQRLDEENNPAPGGWARQSYEYDRTGRLMKLGYQDFMGRPAPVWNGVGFVTMSYDKLGRLASMNYFDSDEKPTDAEPCYPGVWCEKIRFHELVYGYENNVQVQAELYDLAGKHKGTIDCRKGQCF